MDPRDELVGKSVEQAKRIAHDVSDLARTEGRLGVAEARDALGPAAPAIRDGLLALALGTIGASVLLLPVLAALGRRRATCFVSGAVMVASAWAIGRQAIAKVPTDVRDRLRRVLRSDLSAAVDAAVGQTP